MFPNNRTSSHHPSRRGASGANPMAIGGHGPRPSQGPGPSMPIRHASQAQGGPVYAGGDPRVLDAGQPSHHPSRAPTINVHPASHHSTRQPSSSMPPPPPFAGRPSQAGRVASHHPSQSGTCRVSSRHPSRAGEFRPSQAGRASSHHPSHAVRGPSAAQHGGFSDQDFVKVGRAPSHATGLVEPRQPSRRPSAHPEARLSERPSRRSSAHPADGDQQMALASYHPSAGHTDHRRSDEQPGQMVRRPSQGLSKQHGAPAQQYGGALQQHDGQRPVIDTSIYYGQVGASGQRWQGIARKWDNYLAGGGYQ